MASACAFIRPPQSLGLVMPSNSPAVNSLWLPAIPLKIPVVIKPGREEPWTPYRLIQAFIAAGCPAEAFGFYPADHEGAGEILRGCGRALIFGDKNTTAAYANNPAIQIHGPGYSKILIGEDQIERWPEFIDLMVSAISDNGGRSCINASAIVVPKYADEIADALARKLGPVAPLPAADENARLAGFANPKMADFIDSAIEEGLKTPGARDVTAAFRDGPRKVRFEGGIYLRPTIVLCDSFDASAGQPRISLPVRQRRHRAASGHARKNRAVPGRHGDHARPGLHRATGRIAVDRAPEHRPDLHHDRFLGPAARGQHV